ncbi:MAG: PcfK-like family protein, partial [Oscillospiraceae bacterium]|nr:PcfK-like family protein [Oscillospiraceae bacterium]
AWQAALDRIAAMNSAELLAAAVERVAAATERLTRRNMKEAVAEHIQAKCREDAAFALLVMDPAKSMVSCFQYINRKAREYAEQEMKDQGIERSGVYGLDVPDGLCYQWAEDYFKGKNAGEDHKNEEKFVPKPYVPSTRKSSKTKAAKKPEKKKSAAEKPAKAPEPERAMEQISLM